MNTYSFQESERRTVRQEWFVVAVTFVFLLFSALQSKGGIAPVPSVTGLCAEAVVIAEGDYVSNAHVKVLKIYKGAEQVGTNREIVVAGLGKCSKRVRDNGETLQTDRVVLFMDSKLQPLYLIGDGSGGVFWLSDDACYRYWQPMNPGGYALTKLQMKPVDLHSKIEVGLAVAKEWEAVKALKDPKAMAERMAVYLRQVTWPRGYDGEFYRELRERMPKLGADAVSPVVEVLRAGMKEGEDLDLPVLILYDIGRPAQPAVPVLLELLQKPGKTFPYYICSALRTAGDPQAIPAIRTLLGSGDIQAEIEAAGALADMGDKQSFDTIATLLPKVEAGRSDKMHDLLSALYRIDAQKAAPFVEQQLNNPAWAKSLDFIKPANYHSPK